ncbi:MAG: hypothetical protein ACTSWX_12145 [Promethearchaeota archaeon]
MKIFIDTYSWAKIDFLVNSSFLDFNILYRRFEICITHDILKEIQHREIKSCILEEIHIFPIKNRRIYEDAITQQFDKADASLLSNGSRNGDPILITEDHPLLELGKSYQFEIIQLIDFFKILTQFNILSKKKLFQINRELRRLRNISKNKEKNIKKFLQQLN